MIPKSDSFETKKTYFSAVFLFEILIILAGYGCLMVSCHYSVDSFNRLFDAGPFWELQIGRFFNCGALLLTTKIDLNTVLDQQLFLFYGALHWRS